MIRYEQIKAWFEEKENKQKIVVGVCFILVFIMGYGTGKYQDGFGGRKSLNNYSINKSIKPTDTKTVNPEQGTVAGAQGTKTNLVTNDSNCEIKGNISAAGKKIYHVVGGAFYKIVKPEQCFKTESEAQAAGFVKSSR